MTRAPVFFVFSTCYSDSLEVLVLRAGKERENSKGNCKENSKTQKKNGLVRTIILEAVEACGGVVVSWLVGGETFPVASCPRNWVSSGLMALGSFAVFL